MGWFNKNFIQNTNGNHIQKEKPVKLPGKYTDAIEAFNKINENKQFWSRENIENVFKSVNQDNEYKTYSKPWVFDSSNTEMFVCDSKDSGTDMVVIRHPDQARIVFLPGETDRPETEMQSANPEIFTKTFGREDYKMAKKHGIVP